MAAAGCTKLNVEGYGGMNMATWLGPALSVAGRVLVRGADGTLAARLVDLDRDLAVIPSLAPHMDRGVNDGHRYNPQVDMQPLYGPEGCRPLPALLAEALGVAETDMVDWDLTLYVRQAPAVIGPAGEYFMAPRIDDLECAATTLYAFLAAAPQADTACAPVWAMLDNEEVGSGTRQGAHSLFLRDVLGRIYDAVPHSAQGMQRALANSFVLSADNAHAMHPNFADKADAANPVRMGGGIVLKVNASQKYTTSGLSGAVLREVCRLAGVPCAAVCQPRRPARRQHAGQPAEPEPAGADGGHRPGAAGDAQRRGNGQHGRRRRDGQGRGDVLPRAPALPGRRAVYAGARAMTVGRYAPSPSGRMHLGNLCCCLLAWLSAKSKGGRVLLRIEDLDAARCPRRFAGCWSRTWPGWGFPPTKAAAGGGAHAPYYQSERSEIYRHFYDILAAKGLLYPCFCSRSQLHAASAPHRSDGQVVYPGTCRGLTAAQIAEKSRQRALPGACACRMRTSPLPTATWALPGKTWPATAATSMCGGRTGCLPTSWPLWWTTR